MLSSIIKKVFRFKSGASAEITADELLAAANKSNSENDYVSAQKLYREFLEIHPHNVDVINELACCVAAAGDEAGAVVLFEQAFTLDDSHVPASINYATVLKSRWLTDEALQHLRRACILMPDLPNIRTVFGSIRQARGNSLDAKTHSLDGWLGLFDNMRLANSYLFSSSYSDIDEELLTGEHRFWAGTLKAPAIKLPPPDAALQQSSNLYKKNAKVRVAYWSPDLRNHSVIMFFRPLLEGHDREKYEIFIYHDSQLSDGQTEEVRKHSDAFFDVSTMSDQALCDMMWSHDLDVLVEMAGHTSTNRIGLLQLRFAKVQVTGIGYPPTTGLESVDYKLVDRHIVGPGSENFYSESLAVLPSSFWCFDPKEDVPLPKSPPVEKNGYITFGCVGNIAKINPRIASCWAEILKSVPTSRLLIRSINLADPASERELGGMLKDAGIDLQRVDLKKPTGRTEFFDSYNEIDILLDTFPFNGGTTTCFGTYMGVPIVSMAGKSLISRMGKSVLTNLNLQDWVVENANDYVACAVKGASNANFLRQFRRDTRERFLSSPLGNGTLYAREFEALCLELLAEKSLPSGLRKKSGAFYLLSAAELVRRAYHAYRYGQAEAARRIIDYCLKEYKDFGPAHVLWTERLTSNGDFSSAIDYLKHRVVSDSSSNDPLININLIRFCLLQVRGNEAREFLDQIPDSSLANVKDRLQVKQLRAVLEVPCADSAAPEGGVNTFKKWVVIVVNDDISSYEIFQENLGSYCSNGSDITVEFRRCTESMKFEAYEEVLQDDSIQACLWVQKNIFLFNPNIWGELNRGLEYFDVLGFSGAQAWSRIDWRNQAFEEKSGSFVVPSGEKAGVFELHFIGTNLNKFLGDLAVLDGGLLALNLASLRTRAPEFLDEQFSDAGCLMEEYFSFRSASAGFKVGIHQNLGVLVDWRIPLAEKYTGEGRIRIAELMNFEPLLFEAEDRSVISAPVASLEDAMTAQAQFLE